MRWRINRRIYDTETAELVAENDVGEWEMTHERFVKKVYRKRNGEYFCTIRGYIWPCRTGGWSLGTKCVPLTDEEGQECIDDWGL